jgi:spore coat protein U-like protein
MRRIVIVLTGFATLSIVAGNTLSGQQQSATLTVSANVTRNCTIMTAAVSFGAYDPVAANATAPLDGVGTITVACTKGSTATVGLSTGANAEGTARRMIGAASAYLNYELYKDSGRATIWGTDSNALEIGAAPDRHPRAFTVYGRVPQAQDATVGTYTDTVTATVNF